MLYSAQKVEDLMRLRWPGTVCLLLLLSTFFGQSANQPDAVTISGNTVQSEYFKFHYSFPQGWSPQKDEVRLEKNRKRHETAVARAETENSRIVNTHGITTTTKVFWVYDLLFATPAADAERKLAVPYVRVWAMECSNVTNKPGDYAKLMQRVNSSTQTGKTEKITIAGRPLMRSSFMFEGEHFPEGRQFETLFETLSGNFLVIFEFHGKTAEETNELAKTMDSATFEK